MGYLVRATRLANVATAMLTATRNDGSDTNKWLTLATLKASIVTLNAANEHYSQQTEDASIHRFNKAIADDDIATIKAIQANLKAYRELEDAMTFTRHKLHRLITAL